MTSRFGELHASAEDFLRAGIMLRNWSSRTVRTYRQGLATLPAELTTATLAQWVIDLRTRGVRPTRIPGPRSEGLARIGSHG
jgi:hypothetical protein